MNDLPLLGRLAVREGLISVAQLEAAVRAQGRSDGRRRLGDILVEQGSLDHKGLRLLLALQQEQEPASVPAVARPVEPIPTTPPFIPATSLRAMLSRCAAEGINDLFLSSGQPVRVRAHGSYHVASEAPMPDRTVRSLLSEVQGDEHRAVLDRSGIVRRMISIEGVGRFRATLHGHPGGLAAVIRVLPALPPTLRNLGLPSALARLATFARGLVLIGGGLGSGKTSTAAALLDLVNQDRSEFIMTAERQVEYVHDSKRSVVQQRLRRASHGLEQVLGPARHRPSVLLVDPLRDEADLRAVLRLAETGHLVYAIVRSIDVVSTLSLLSSMVDASERGWLREELGRTLRAVVCQRLLPRVGGQVVAAVEQMLVSDYLADIIRDGRFHEIRSVLQAGESQGMLDMQRSIRALREQELTP